MSALQKGVLVPLPFGAGELFIRDFVCGMLKISPSEFSRQIRTIILNNRAVDEPETTPLSEGDTLVLSGAMPGLVGAMLRAGSPVKAMRASISGPGNGAKTAGRFETNVFRLKIFNTVLRDYKTKLLNYGVFRDE